MISSVSSLQSTSLLNTLQQITQTREAMQSAGTTQAGSTAATSSTKAPSFGDMISDLVKSVDTKSKESDAIAQDVFTGKSDNIHQAMLSMQEAGVAFTLMTEVRNKLVTSYQELMRMQV